MSDREQLQHQIWNELEQAKTPLTRTALCDRIGCSEFEFNEAKKNLVRTGSLYHCQEGFVLREYATYDQQLWHLSWSLGLLEVSAIHLEMDEQLLLEAPKAIQRLLIDGRMNSNQRERLNALRQKVISAITVPQRLLQMYHKVQNVIEEEQEELKRLTEGPKKFNSFSDLKSLKKKQ